MEASQHSLLAACFTLHSINATLAIVPQRGAGLWIAPLHSSRSSAMPERDERIIFNLFLNKLDECLLLQKSLEINFLLSCAKIH
jgi:hypothetical protein